MQNENERSGKRRKRVGAARRHDRDPQIQETVPEVARLELVAPDACDFQSVEIAQDGFRHDGEWNIDAGSFGVGVLFASLTISA